MNEFELRWIIKDKSVEKDENTEGQKDNTQDSEGTKMKKYELLKVNLDKKTNRQ